MVSKTCKPYDAWHIHGLAGGAHAGGLHCVAMARFELGAEMLDQPDQIRTLLSEHFQPWTRMVTDYIRMGQQAGSVRADVDADSWVAQVVTMVIGTAACGDVTSALVSEPGGTSVSLKQQIDELVRIAGRSLFNVRPDAGQEPEDG